MRRVLDIGLTGGMTSAINRGYELIWGLAMKLKILVIACILILPLGLIYAQGDSDSPPGHDGTRGQGHERHVGIGNGHDKFDLSPS